MVNTPPLPTDRANESIRGVHSITTFKGRGIRRSNYKGMDKGRGKSIANDLSTNIGARSRGIDKLPCKRGGISIDSIRGQQKGEDSLVIAATLMLKKDFSSKM